MEDEKNDRNVNKWKEIKIEECERINYKYTLGWNLVIMTVKIMDILVNLVLHWNSWSRRTKEKRLSESFPWKYSLYSESLHNNKDRALYDIMCDDIKHSTLQVTVSVTAEAFKLIQIYTDTHRHTWQNTHK